MTRDEAISLARNVAENEGWEWRDPIVATKARMFIVAGPASWHVMSNADCRGCNVNVQIDDQSGHVTSKGFAPR